MRTKEEILGDLNSISHPIKGIGDIQHDIIKVEVLLDIRDILAEAFKEEIVVKEAEKFNDRGEFEEAVKT